MQSGLRRQCGAVLFPVLFLSGFAAIATAADEFAAPPKAEREVVAAVGKAGGRVQVDAEYRVVALTFGAEATNDDLKGAAVCERLTQVTLGSRKIDDGSLETLKALSKLTSLSLTNSGISADGAAALRAALPNCRITTPFPSSRAAGGIPAARPAGDTPAAPRGTGGFGGRTSGAPGFGGFGSSANRRGLDLLQNASIQDDLKLNVEQRDKFSSVKVSAALAAFRKTQEEQALAALTPEQRARLKQLELQQLGPQVFLREEIVKQLEITAEQQAAIRKVIDDSAAESRTLATEGFRRQADGSLPDVDKLREQLAAQAKARDEKIQAALNDKQREAWKALAGPPGPPVSSTTFGGGPGGSGGFASRPPTDPAAAAKAYFDRYDTDKDGKLTDAELSPTGRARTNMVAAGIELKFPAAREDFEKAYANYLEGTRTRTVPLNPAEAAKALVALLDKDGDGTITEAEFPAGDRTRDSLTRAGIELKFPISREELEKAYAKYREQNSRSRE